MTSRPATALSAATLADIDRHAATHGFELVPVFIMPDPVERCWSAFRMQHQADDDAGELLDDQLEQAFVEFARSPGAELRTRYDRTLAALADSVGLERAVVTVFERLFSGAGLRGLADRLGVECREDAVERRVHPSSVLPRPSDQAWAAVASLAEVMPEVRDVWGGFASL